MMRPSLVDDRILQAGWRRHPISDGPAFRPDASNTAADQEQQWGMHDDAVYFLPLPGGLPIDRTRKGYRPKVRRGLLVQNHEYSDDVLLFADGTANWNAAKTAKSLAAHGLSVIELCWTNGTWEAVRPSWYARRITGATPTEISGPAAGHELLRTNADPTGTRVLGTLDNCSVGHTLWNTYLACEENLNQAFQVGKLDDGILYAGKFNADGTGQWLPLTFGQGPLVAPAFTSRADVLINAGPTPASATTRGSAPTRRRARPAASSSARTCARSPVWS